MNNGLVPPFNGPLETGLRSLVLLSELHPDSASVERLVVFDYLVVHSDDIPGGPRALHPRTPNRSGELLVRRESVRAGLLLFSRRGLVAQSFTPRGIRYTASEASGWFLDSLDSQYVHSLRDTAEWLIAALNDLSDPELQLLVKEHLGEWGAEYATQSVLWAEETE